MRIMIITPRLCSGGAERVSVTWANALAQREHEVVVVADLFSPINYQLDAAITTLSYTDGKHQGISKWWNAIIRVRTYLKQCRPDVIIGVMSTCSLLGKLSSIGLNIPIIATEHDAFDRPKAGKLTWLERILKFHVNKLYSRVTILTTPDAEYLKGRLKNIAVLPNPLALTPITTMPAKKPMLLAVGRLDDWKVKGFDLLIEAWGKIAKNYPDWNLHIAGDGSDESLSFLKSLCQKFGVNERVVFLGFRKDVETLFREASIFVLSSRYEGFGLVLIEAMSQGCACVACDYKGRQAEIFGGNESGLACEVDSVVSLQHAMTAVLDNPELREHLRQNAVERSRVYSVNRVMERWDNLLNDVVLHEA